MKGIFAVLVFMLSLCGCTQQKKESWNYGEGYVVAKENDKVLVVRNKVANINAPLSEILANESDAIWLTVTKDNSKAVNIGDKVTMAITDGIIEQSYPGQAAGTLEVRK
ncbi:DUF3221 domain-containing protein [Paenibacillus aestuarii]|uniref:DUF3221 domain-containing protein n=1 Tax=Paenibacillus aestuarii TaxID=516965 RepID=A0ABW0K0V2_9BACL|nr:DUF3221 domain-containing protein [Paenibacillus aestuarii]